MCSIVNPTFIAFFYITFITLQAILDFEEEIGKEVFITFPENFCKKIIDKLSRNQLKSKSISNIVSKIHQVEGETHKNILALHLLAYQFDCVNDDKNRRLSKVEIADAFIQFREVSQNE